MFIYAKRYGLTDEKTVKCSQELDILLNLYRKMFSNSPRTMSMTISA
jgi:hypothetical protein